MSVVSRSSAMVASERLRGFKCYVLIVEWDIRTLARSTVLVVSCHRRYREGEGLRERVMSCVG